MTIKMNYNFQFYKEIKLQLIRRDYTGYDAKRFTLNGTNQNVWIPNKHLLEDGTIKQDENIDYVFRRAIRQLELAGYTGPIIGIKRTTKVDPIIYVRQLTWDEQQALLSPLEAKLKEEGLSKRKIYRALADARDSKISDIQDQFPKENEL